MATIELPTIHRNAATAPIPPEFPSRADVLVHVKTFPAAFIVGKYTFKNMEKFIKSSNQYSTYTITGPTHDKDILLVNHTNGFVCSIVTTQELDNFLLHDIPLTGATPMTRRGRRGRRGQRGQRGHRATRRRSRRT